MRIHKEGASIILITAVFAAVVMVSAAYLLPSAVAWAVAVAALACVVFVTSFFRCPSRPPVRDENGVYSPADGTVVALEEVEENEYFHRHADRRFGFHVDLERARQLVSRIRNGRLFPASPRDVHGRVASQVVRGQRRTTTVIDMGGQKILFRQIAGLVARRIVSYARVGGRAEQNTQCGFIKFGSRVDLFLPTDADVQVRLGDKVVGTQTLIARLKKKE